MVTGNIADIISLRIHPHPEPTAEPTFEPTAEPTVVDDDDEMYDGGMPQPRNERPWEELQNSTDAAGDMEGRDAEDEDEDEDGGVDSDDEDPASDDGLLNLLDQVDNNGEATTNSADDAETKGTGGGMEIIDVSPGEYAVPFTPAPAAVPVVPPTAAIPTAAPVTASPTRKPTLAPTKLPTIGESVQLIFFFHWD